MKKLLIGLLVLGSFSSFAHKKKTYLKCSNPDKAIKLTLTKNGSLTLTEDLERFTYVQKINMLQDETFKIIDQKSKVIVFNLKSKKAILTKNYENDLSSSFILSCSRAIDLTPLL